MKIRLTPLLAYFINKKQPKYTPTINKQQFQMSRSSSSHLINSQCRLHTPQRDMTLLKNLGTEKEKKLINKDTKINDEQLNIQLKTMICLIKNMHHDFVNEIKLSRETNKQALDEVAKDNLDKIAGCATILGVVLAVFVAHLQQKQEKAKEEDQKENALSDLKDKIQTAKVKIVNHLTELSINDKQKSQYLAEYKQCEKQYEQATYADKMLIWQRMNTIRDKIKGIERKNAKIQHQIQTLEIFSKYAIESSAELERKIKPEDAPSSESNLQAIFRPF